MIRIPSLDPVANPYMFNNSDSVIAIYGPHSSDFHVWVRTFQFDPMRNSDNKYESFDQYTPYAEWDKKAKGYLRQIDSISATTFIDRDGNYCLTIGFNCWDMLGKKDKHVQAIHFVTYYITYQGDICSARYNGTEDPDSSPTSGDTFQCGHYLTLITYTKPTSRYTADQIVGVIMSSGGSAWLFNKKSQAYLDWNPKTLGDNQIHPEPTSGFDPKTGDGMLVTGMILCAPPHPVAGPEDYKNAYVCVSNALRNYEYNGTSEKYSDKTTMKIGGLGRVVPIGGGASYEWSQSDSRSEGEAKYTSIEYTLQDYEYNMVIGIMPKWDFKSAVLKGKNGGNVKCYDIDNPSKINPYPYVLTSAIFDDSGTNTEFRKSYTVSPGQGRDGEVVLTKGMKPYSITEVDGGTNLVTICDNLKELAKAGIIKTMDITAPGRIGNTTPSKITFNITKDKQFSSTTDNAWSGNVKLGGKVFSVANEFKATVTKTSGSKSEDSDGMVFGYTGIYSQGAKSVMSKPVVYIIPVKALKSKYSERTEENKLTFIPDYMWSKGMDYWLIAYDDIGAVSIE